MQSKLSIVEIKRRLINGIIAGMVASLAMAMVAMLASSTYMNKGFFTPLYFISSVFGSTTALMESVKQTALGNAFWFDTSAALLGALVHMITAAMFGALFFLIVPKLSKSLVLGTGIVFGLVVAAFSGFIALPIAGSLSGAGSTLSNMANIVGWGTWALEHAVYGMSLGILYPLFKLSVPSLGSTENRKVASAHQ